MVAKIVVADPLEGKVLGVFGQPIPHYSKEEMDDLPRFIIRNCEPFMFVNERKHSPKELRIPYSKMLFELGPEDNYKTVVVSSLDHTAVKIQIIRLDYEVPFTIGAEAVVRIHKQHPLFITRVFKDDDLPTDEVEQLITIIIGYIAEFQVGNLTINSPVADHVPHPGKPKQASVNRIVRVVMGVVRVRKPWNGGTHASPRKHTRAGHWRTLKNGDRRWIDEVIVNADKPGQIEKTYIVSKQ